MLLYLLRRLGAGVVLVFLVTGLTFVLTYSADIPVARNILGPQATDEQIAILNARLGLDKSLWQQYTDWLGGLFHGDLGKSYFSGQDVTDALTSRLPVTLSVVVLAMIITLLASTALGIASAARRGWLDNVLQGISTIAFVFPGIVLAIVLVYVFAIQLRWVPAVGYTTFADDPQAWFSSVILPAIVLAIGGIASLGAQIRGSMIDQLERDYVRTLRTRGVSGAVDAPEARAPQRRRPGADGLLAGVHRRCSVPRCSSRRSSRSRASAPTASRPRCRGTCPR